MHARGFQAVLAALIGALIGTGSAIDYGWRITLAAAVLLVLAGLAVRALRRANRTHHQINRDELDDPDPFGMQVRHDPADTDTTGETR